MAKVIKRGGHAPASPAKQPPKTPPKRSGKVIDREVYNAQQTAQQTIIDGENEKKNREEKGVAAAKEAYESNFLKAQKEAEQNLAFSLITIFKQRLILVDTAMEDVHMLSMEVAYKILGAKINLPQSDQEKISSQIKEDLLSQRRLTIGVTPAMLSKIELETQELFTLLTTSPDFQLQSDAKLQDHESWVAAENLKFNTHAMALLEHLASTYDLPAPLFAAPKQAATLLGAPLDAKEERTMAISLEELKQRAMA